MKRLYLLLILCACCLVNNAWAQNRNIYIWDVTASMEGRGTTDSGEKTPNVYDDVEGYLINDIQRVANAYTEIVVIPFQEGVLSDYILTVPNSTDESKQEIIDRIKEVGPKCLKLSHRRTNISEPLLFAKSKYQKSDKENKIVLLTDGYQNMKGGMEALAEAVNSWDRQAEECDFLVYVLTTKNAIKPTDDLVNGDYVPVDHFVDQVERLLVKPTPEVSFNIKDNKSIAIYFKNNSSISLPVDAKIRVKSEVDAPIVIDEVVELVNGQIQLSPNYDYATLKHQLAEREQMRLNLSVENNDILVKEQKKKLIIVPNYSQVTLINKKERVLTISIVE